MFRKYYLLTKPGIVRGNLVTATAGFFLASQGTIDWWLYLAMVVGLAGVIASGCVVNNWLEREIDAKMERTKKRALATGDISVKKALIFAAVLGLTGTLLLVIFTNLLTAVIAVSGWLVYAAVYTWWKRQSAHSTVIGSVAGAVPPVAGYTAVSNQLDTGALIIFLILVFWQMPHFYSIGIFRAKEYAKAGLPILPLKRNPKLLKYSILLYVVGFTVISGLLTTYGYTSTLYLLLMLVLGSAWLWLGIQGLSMKSNDIRWAKRMFGFSILVLAVWSGVVIVDSLVNTAI